MANYNDLMIRDYFGDDGAKRSGNLSASPDIIPNGTIPYPDFQTALVTSSIVGKDIGQNIIGFQPNYLYVRAFNKSANPASGKLYLHYSPSNLLMAPGLWGKNILQTQSGNQFANVTNVTSGQYAVGDSPFLWVPQPPPNNSHFCMVSRIVTDTHPNPVPTDVSTFDGFVNYVVNNPAVAWRNVTFVGTPPDWSVVTPLEGFDSSETVYFQVNCVNVPINSKVGFSSPAPGAYPAVNLQPTVVSTQPNFSAGIWTKLDAKWKGDVTTYWYSEGQAGWGPGASIDTTCFWFPPPSKLATLHPSIERHFKPASFFGINHSPDWWPTGQPMRGFPLGRMRHQP